ncbi:hypothetical protein [Thalassoglobus polymorphus]|uniref:Uncharacterized protein n=1 Tax=Thalassoglobus polymorphus TaxID=2527994 RepID=A0A517QSB8_9PLAN|nr:hypothetical protein [Thalassoglobus polymorphus]QDT34502.1 hypothetical protein Mal48_37630 [Thalassoglobus polymorphus]
MFAKMTTIASSIALLTLLGSTAQASEHNARYRHLDDIVFAAYVDARELRWELHDDFIASHDYEHLLEDADAILTSLQKLERTILRENSDLTIAREADLVQRNLSTLTRHLNGSDFARGRHERHRTTYNGRGYVFSPETQHVGRTHVRTALRLIAKIEDALAHLRDEVRPISHHHRSTPPRAVPVPQPQPGPILVPRNSSYRPDRSVEIPVGNHRSLRIGF